MQHCKMQHNKMQHSKMQYSKMQHRQMQHRKTQHCKMWHSKMQHSNMQHATHYIALQHLKVQPYAAAYDLHWNTYYVFVSATPYITYKYIFVCGVLVQANTTPKHQNYTTQHMNCNVKCIISYTYWITCCTLYGEVYARHYETHSQMHKCCLHAETEREA